MTAPSKFPPNKSSKGRSRYPDRWVTSDGTKMRLEDMSLTHLQNTRRWIERKVKEDYGEVRQTAWSCYGYLQGEMALMDMEQAIDSLEEDGPYALLPDVYTYMREELERRGIKDEDQV